MAGEIQIRKDFPPARERAVLMELLNLMRALKEENIDAIICGGWVPFLKELAHDTQTRHSMSFDIDVLLQVKAREREAVDRIKTLLSKSLAYTPNKDASFRYEKKVDGNIVQLDLLTDLPRVKEARAKNCRASVVLPHCRGPNKTARKGDQFSRSIVSVCTVVIG